MRKTIAIALTTFALGAAATQAFADRQPAMKDALRHLEKAEKSLEAATADKGGHRVKALALVREAIEQTKEGIKHDNQN